MLPNQPEGPESLVFVRVRTIATPVTPAPRQLSMRLSLYRVGSNDWASTSVMSRGSSGISEYTNFFFGQDEVDQRDPTGWGERENNKQKRERERESKHWSFGTVYMVPLSREIAPGKRAISVIILAHAVCECHATRPCEAVGICTHATNGDLSTFTHTAASPWLSPQIPARCVFGSRLGLPRTRALLCLAWLSWEHVRPARSPHGQRPGGSWRR